MQRGPDGPRGSPAAAEPVPAAAAAGSASPAAAGHQPAERCRVAAGGAAGGGGGRIEDDGQVDHAASARRPARPTRNGRRSSSVRSSTRTMRGVSVRTMSVSCVSRRLCANSRPTSGRSLRPGHAFEHAPLVVANQARQQVRLAVLQPDHRVDLAVAERRQTAEPGARDAADVESSAPATPRRRDACAA